jgi:AcrR family transcriptional regulator
LSPVERATTRKAEQSEATRAALVAAARKLFSARGYQDVGTEEIVRAAQVTRGALYHHFSDKRDLLRAVHEEIEGEIVAAIGEQMAGIEDPVELLRTGVSAFLDICTRPEITQITLVDSPSVLGWQEWREIDMRYSLGLVTAGLQAGMDQGALRPQPVLPLAHLMVAALGEAGLMMAGSDDPGAARAEVEPALLALLDGLRP